MKEKKKGKDNSLIFVTRLLELIHHNTAAGLSVEKCPKGGKTIGGGGLVAKPKGALFNSLDQKANHFTTVSGHRHTLNEHCHQRSKSHPPNQ